MKKTVTILIAVGLLFALSACGSGSAKTEPAASYTDNPKAEITVRDYGTITLELYPDVAPLTVDNFVKLCNEGFYDGVKNELSHKRGVISMARAKSPDSASSQFFIVHQDSEFLDGSYAAFGAVTEGIEVVDAICEKTPVIDNNGTVPSEYQPVIESIKIIE